MDTNDSHATSQADGAFRGSQAHMSLVAAVAVGVGGMIGAGIFSMLGVVATVAGTALPLVFVLGGTVAVFSVYSYARLGARYPTVGGPVQFLVQGLGDGVLSGGLNVFQYCAYVISLALYAEGFAGYAAALFHEPSARAVKILAVGIVLVFVAVNFVGAAFMGKAETLIVAAKVGILVLFAVVGLFFIDPARVSPDQWKGSFGIVYATAIAFIGFQGFGLVTNAAGNMVNPKTELPRALFIAFGITLVIYLLVAVVVVGTTPMSTIVGSTDDLLAVVAKGFMGAAGFALLASAALLSTSSAVNATLFGAANIAYQIAKDGELPKDVFLKKLWNRNVEGLFITAALVILLVLFLDLAPVSMMASGAFLIVYTAVNAAHLRIIDETGARRALVWAGLLLTAGMFAALFVYMVRYASAAAWITLIGAFALSFAVEAAYRGTTGRKVSIILESRGSQPPGTGAALR